MTRTRSRKALFLGVLLGLAAPARAREVTHDTRVDDANKVWVDVENDSTVDIVVASAVVSFYDKRGTLLDKSTIDCDHDCGVRKDESESFGPLEGPKGWDTVKVTKVYYGSAKTPAPAPKAPAPPAPAQAAPAPAPMPVLAAAKPSAPSAPAAPPAAGTSSRFGCVDLCKKMNSVPGCASPEDASSCPASCAYLEKPTACRAKLELSLDCAQRTTFTCSGAKVNLGACDAPQDDFMKCVMAH